MTRCTACGSEFTDAQIKGESACPSCGSRGVPMDTAKDVTIRINVHELRILGIWADNYARSIRDRAVANGESDPLPALRGILGRIRKQILDCPPLTMFEELDQLHAHGYDATLTDASGKVIKGPPKKGQA